MYFLYIYISFVAVLEGWGCGTGAGRPRLSDRKPLRDLGSTQGQHLVGAGKYGSTRAGEERTFHTDWVFLFSPVASCSILGPAPNTARTPGVAQPNQRKRQGKPGWKSWTWNFQAWEIGRNPTLPLHQRQPIPGQQWSERYGNAEETN